MKTLDFMIIGSQKAGTTPLAQFLKDHPEIEMSEPKEMHLFDDLDFGNSGNSDWLAQRYTEGFAGRDIENKKIGEATPIYMYLPGVVPALREYNPRLKVIVLLRDPVERAYSHYKMETARQAESKPYWVALLSESLRLLFDKHPREEGSAHRVYSYRSRGYYSSQLDAIYQAFPAEQVLILFTNDLRDRHDETLANVFRFIGVPNTKIESRAIFSQESSTADVPFSSYLLRLAYLREYARLRSQYKIDTANWCAGS